jgi:uncharacterized protein
MPKIAITSDIHNNEINLKKVLDYCGREKIETIICCGDLASLETLDFLNDNFSGIILYTFGNADYDDLRELGHSVPNRALSAQVKYRNTYIYKDYGEAVIEKKNVAFVHYPEKARGLARTGKYDFIFYGHTHKPWIEKAKADENQRGYTLLNPGTVAGEIYPPTFAVWETDTDKFELIRIHELK